MQNRSKSGASCQDSTNFRYDSTNFRYDSINFRYDGTIFRYDSTNLSIDRPQNIQLDDGQGDATNLLIDIEGIDIGHTTDIVNDSHQAGLEVRRVDVVLAAHTAEELF